MKFQTLHSHTKASDGNLSHDEILEVCQANNIGVVAFTDHDSLPNAKTINKLKQNRSDVKWIIGIEVSSGAPKNCNVDFSPHIVGLFVNPLDLNLLDHCKNAQSAREERMKKIVKNLNGLGFKITGNECLRESGGESVGRPHIVKVLMSKPENMLIIEELRKKMEKDANGNLSIKNKYDKMTERGETQYPYELFLSDDSYIKGVYIDYSYRPDMDACVGIIRNAGGVALFAHWFTEINKFGEKQMESLLSENRIDGAETVYGFYDKIDKDFIIQRKILRKLINKYNKLEGGGVDAHSREHFEMFAKNKFYAGMTVGMAEKIIKKSKVDLTWSSFI